MARGQLSRARESRSMPRKLATIAPWLVERFQTGRRVSLQLDGSKACNWPSCPLTTFMPVLPNPATVTAADFRGLRKLKHATGKRFAAGVVLHDGEISAGFDDGLYAVPIRALWETI